MKKLIPAALLLFALTIAACAGSPHPTETPVPTLNSTLVPTAASAPTNTSIPPTEAPSVASEWGGFPIMPGAVAGDGDEESYVFNIRATPQQVQEYYELELGKQGWQSRVEGDGSNSLNLIFTKDASTTLTVSIIAKEDESLVLLAK